MACATCGKSSASRQTRAPAGQFQASSQRSSIGGTRASAPAPDRVTVRLRDDLAASGKMTVIGSVAVFGTREYSLPRTQMVDALIKAGKFVEVGAKLTSIPAPIVAAAAGPAEPVPTDSTPSEPVTTTPASDEPPAVAKGADLSQKAAKPTVPPTRSRRGRHAKAR